MAKDNEEGKVINLNTREEKIEWMRSQGVLEDEIAVMFAIEDEEIEGDVVGEEDAGI